MGTLAAMKARIADDLARTDLTAQIANAINDAILQYQTTRFYFNETSTAGFPFTTIPSQSIYDTATTPNIPAMFKLDGIYFSTGGAVYLVAPLSLDSYKRMSTPSTYGQPYRHVYMNQSLTIYPTPDAAYNLSIYGAYRVAAPANDTDTANVWMNDAERLIRNAAKRIIAQEVLRDNDLATLCGSREAEALLTLNEATASIIRTGHVVPTSF